MRKVLTVVSTFVMDIILNSAGVQLDAKPGGPAAFFVPVFRGDPAVKFVAGQRLRVEITATDHGEVGKVPAATPQIVPEILTPATLISTLCNEWDISALAGRYRGDIFIDVQGFVREPGGGFGQKRPWPEIVDLKPFCVKGTEQELTWLPPDFVADQRTNRCLVITKGAEGSEIWHSGTCVPFRPTPVNPPDTIGAGDTYFATLVQEFLRYRNWTTAGQTATDAATAFLSRKRKRA